MYEKPTKTLGSHSFFIMSRNLNTYDRRKNESKKEFLSSVEILILTKPFVLYAKYPRNKFYSIHHAIYPSDVKDKRT